ncbi:acyltransferase family protein [Microbacterium sp.]|uniref:acyltransferase family protein n=1 Tax=Microbacterium sp. TaxID=51671 RepID=UPI003A93C6EC
MTATSYRPTADVASESTATSRPHRIRADIQGLRALAVILVMLAHTFGWPSGGYIGVDVFFVISGFVITSLLMREVGRNGTISLANFYRRRIRRIIPAAAVVTVFTVLAAFVLLPADRSREVWYDAVAATFFGANWRMAALNTDYFQEGLPPSPFQHYWSLSVEEQFYFVWPALIILALVLAHKAGVRKNTLAVWVPALTLVLLSFVLCVAQTSSNQNFAYFSSFVRFWELGIGVCIALSVSRLGRMPRAARVALWVLGFIAIVIAALTLTPGSAFPGSLALLPTLGAGAIIVAGTGAPLQYDRDVVLLTNPVARYIGDRSYSLYLWHFPLVALAPAILPTRKLTSIGIFIASFLLAELAYRFLEDPIRKSNWLEKGWRRSPARGTRRAVATLTVLLSVLTTAGIAGSGLVNEGGSTTVARTSTDCFGAASLKAKPGSCAPTDSVQPSLSKLQADTGGAFSSDCYRSRDAKPVSCTFGSTSKDAIRIALIGDSHAGMYMGILRDIAPKLNWSVTTYVGWGCQWSPHDGEPCEDQTAVAERAFTGSTPYDVIITAASRGATSSWTRPMYEDAARMWQRAADAGSRIIAMQSVPIPSEEALQCFQRVTYDPTKDTCQTSAAKAYAPADAIAAIAKLVRGGVDTVPTRDLICPGSECSAVIGGVIVSRDTAGHLTGTYLKTLEPYIQKRLTALIPSHDDPGRRNG